MGPFKEEEEGAGIASDKVKVPVEGEDPVTTGDSRSRGNPGTVTIPQYELIKQSNTHKQAKTKTTHSEPELKNNRPINH